nr:TlpA disulfide reductase family protein [Aquitalea magnusonii]
MAQTRFTDQAGSSVSLRAYQGKVVLVNFWATWCGPCREEMPMLNSLRDRLAPKGVEVVGIALDNKAETYNFARQLRIGYPILLGDSDTLSLLRTLGNPAVPCPTASFWTATANRWAACWGG